MYHTTAQNYILVSLSELLIHYIMKVKIVLNLLLLVCSLCDYRGARRVPITSQWNMAAPPGQFIVLRPFNALKVALLEDGVQNLTI